jgi:hypothetical protein
MNLVIQHVSSNVILNLLFSYVNPSLGKLDPRKVFIDFDRCFYNLLFETNNFGLDAFLTSCLVS